MDNKGNINQNQEKQEANKNNATSKKDLSVLKITIIVLILIIGVLIFFWLNTRQSLREITEKKIEREELNIELERELDSLMYEYTEFKNRHDSILYDKDSIIQQSAKEIDRLIAMEADYYRIRRRLDALQDIAQDYVMKIDSLYTVAEVLRVERDEARDEADRAKDYASELEADREELTSKVKVASALSAHQVEARGFRTRGFTGREVESDRARRVEYIEVCFTIAENPVAPEGPQNIYVRVARPDEKILRISDEDEYAFVHNQDTLQFTMNQEINYQNRQKKLCLTWDEPTEYIEGMYLVSIYTDEHRIGESAFTLR